MTTLLNNIQDERQCGSCSVCCTVGEVPELEKPAYVSCKHIKTNECGSCSLYNSSNLPKVCASYRCSWLNGWGTDRDRPDKNNVMITMNMLENQIYFTAIELEEKAIFSFPAKTMLEDIVIETKIPIIVSKFGKKPPHDRGDLVIINEEIFDRCKRICGELISMHSRDDGTISVYELIKGK